MSTGSLDIFSLRDRVVAEYETFATSFTTIFAADIRDQVAAIYADKRYWPEPLIQINPSYRRDLSVPDFIATGLLHPGCAAIFRGPVTAGAPQGEALRLYKHQEQAVVLAHDGESFVVTTGTGSGKSL